MKRKHSDIWETVVRTLYEWAGYEIVRGAQFFDHLGLHEFERIGLRRLVVEGYVFQPNDWQTLELAA